jgi:hypothetical protein
MKVLSLIAVLVTALGLSGIAHAEQAVGPGAFYGRYHGTAQAHDPHGLPMGFDWRDFDVEIGQADNGFFVAWTTVMKSIRGKEVRRKSTRIVYEPTGRPGIYVQKAGAAEIANGISWATISGRTLTVRVAAILDDGTYEIQTYERTLVKDGLQLLFRSDRNGSVSKIATAYSKKESQ